MEDVHSAEPMQGFVREGLAELHEEAGKGIVRFKLIFSNFLCFKILADIRNGSIYAALPNFYTLGGNPFSIHSPTKNRMHELAYHRAICDQMP